MRAVAGALAGAGIVAAPCLRAEDVVTDPHVAARDMLVEIPRTDGVEQPGPRPRQPDQALRGARAAAGAPAAAG